MGSEIPRIFFLLYLFTPQGQTMYLRTPTLCSEDVFALRKCYRRARAHDRVTTKEKPVTQKPSPNYSERPAGVRPDPVPERLARDAATSTRHLTCHLKRAGV